MTKNEKTKKRKNEKTSQRGFTLIELLLARHPKLPWPSKPWLSGQRRKATLGFTLIELLLVIGIFSILALFTTINLIKPQTKASVEGTTLTVTTDVKAQQLKSMAGDTEGAATSQSHGIHFEASSYIIFRGSIYNSSEPSNFTVDLDTNLTFSNINLPTTDIIFLKRSGEVSGFNPAQNSITLQNSVSGEQKTISFNRYGAITIN